MRRLLRGALAAALVASSGVANGRSDDDGFVSLFDGKTLKGWIPRGGGKYSVDNGTLLGVSGTGAHGWLCSEKTYGDFILELEARAEDLGNSGIQVRSRILDNNDMIGYQLDFDRTRPSSGRLYDEGRRKLLQDVPLDPECRNALKPEGWNRIRIECVGDHIRSWVNGVAIVDYRDPVDPEGIIALQVHSGLRKRVRMRWRNIRIKDLGRHRWTPIFDGKSLGGWEKMPGGTWTVEDGVIVGRSVKAEKRHGLLLTRKRYRDFTVKLKFRISRGDSGLYFRVHKVPGPANAHGLQAQVSPRFDTAGLYELGGRKWVQRPDPEELKQHYRPGEWTEMVVSAHGRRIVVHLNGWKATEVRNDTGRAEGLLGLQLHARQDMEVEFKDIALLLPAGNE